MGTVYNIAIRSTTTQIVRSGGIMSAAEVVVAALKFRLVREAGWADISSLGGVLVRHRYMDNY